MEHIKRKIKKVLRNHPEGLMAKDIARRIGYTKTQVNSVLYSCPDDFSMNNYVWKNKTTNDKSDKVFRVDTIPIKKKPDGIRYHYYNCNPHRRLTDDCVIRAISAITGDSWEDVLKALVDTSIETGYFINTPECYGVYLESLGYIKRKQPTTSDGKKVKFKDFVVNYDGHAFCHCGKGHVTYVADNSAWDIWDVSDEIVGVYWSMDE